MPIISPTTQTATATADDAASPMDTPISSSPATGTADNVVISVANNLTSYRSGVQLVRASIQYSANSGGTWADIVFVTGNASHTGTDTKSLGNAVNLAAVQIQAHAAAQAVATCNASAQINSWTISYSSPSRRFFIID